MKRRLSGGDCFSLKGGKMNTETLRITFIDYSEFIDLCREPFADFGLDIETMTVYDHVATFHRVATRDGFAKLKPSKDYKALFDRLNYQDGDEIYHDEIYEILAEFVMKGLLPMSDFIIH
jgi:hypothetical protein